YGAASWAHIGRTRGWKTLLVAEWQRLVEQQVTRGFRGFPQVGAWRKEVQVQRVISTPGVQVVPRPGFLVTRWSGRCRLAELHCLWRAGLCGAIMGDGKGGDRRCHPSSSAASTTV